MVYLDSIYSINKNKNVENVFLRVYATKEWKPGGLLHAYHGYHGSRKVESTGDRVRWLPSCVHVQESVRRRLSLRLSRGMNSKKQ